MNAIALLERQHENALELLNELRASAPGDERVAMFKKLQHTLLVHMLLEEEVFYPTVANHIANGEPFSEGYEENAQTRALMGRCARVLDDEALFQLRLGAIEALLSHHVKRERRSMFYAACEVFDATQLERIGQTMKSLYETVVRASIANIELDIASTARALRAQNA